MFRRHSHAARGLVGLAEGGNWRHKSTRRLLEMLERRLLLAGPALDWSSYLSGSGDDNGRSIALDASGDAWVTGGTDSPGWISGGLDTTYNGDEDWSVAKIGNLAGYQSPTDITLSASSIAENQAAGTVVGLLGTTDPDAGDTFTYSLVSGTGDTDNASFTISGSTLQTAARFDYESKNSYSIRVRSTDQDWLWYEKAFTISVSDVNERPTNITLTPASIAENRPPGTAVGTLSARDPDAGNTFTYSLVSGAGGTDNASFTISGNQLLTVDSFNYEAVDRYSIRVRTTDQGGLIFERVFTIRVTNVNEVPTDLAISSTSVNEGQLPGAVVGDLWSSDVDIGDTFIYTLVSGVGDDDNASFTTEDSALKTAAIFNAAAKSSYSVRVRSTDAGGLWVERAFGISVTTSGVPTAVWSSYLGGSVTDDGYSIALDASGNAWVTGETQSPDWVSGGFDTSYNGGGDAFVAKINASGTLAWSSYLGGSDNDYGYGIALDRSGNAWVTGSTSSSGWVFGGFDTILDGTRDAFVAKINANGTLAWSSYLGGSGDDDGEATALDVGGDAWVMGRTNSSGWTSGGFDTSYNGGSDGFVAKINANGTLGWSSYLGGSGDDQGNSIALDAGGNAWVMGNTAGGGWASGGFDTSYNGGLADAFVAKINANGTLGWSSYLGGSSDDWGNSIALDGGGNAWMTGRTSSPGWTIGGFDNSLGGGSDGFVAKINANGTLGWSSYLGGSSDDWGNSVALDADGNAWVMENTAAGGWASGGFDTSYNGGGDGFVANINANGTLGWSSYLGGSSDDWGNSIAVDGSGRAWVTGHTYSPGWTSGGFDTSYNGGSDGFVAKISVNHAATALGLSSSTIAENQPAGTVVGTLGTTDVDAGSIFTYSLASGTGSSDNASFSISGNQLVTAAIFDYESRNSYSIRLRTTDEGGLVFEKVFTISVTNVIGEPTDIALSSTSIQEGQLSGTVVGVFSTSDPDMGDSFTYTLVGGAGAEDNASFTISGSTLQTAAILNCESAASLSIRVRSTDQGGLVFEKVFTISVTNVNEAPTDLALSSTSVQEGQPPGAIVGVFATSDVDIGDSFTYTLVSGAGSADNASFTISGSTLRTAAILDVATRSSYSIRVRTTDQGGLWFEKIFTVTVTVTESNQAPTDITLSVSSIAENQPSGTAVGTLGTIDPDAGNTFTYSLVSGTGSTDNASFTISGSALRTAAMFNFETKSSYSIRVRSTDQGGLWFEKAFAITVTNVNEMPTDISLSASSIAENLPSGTGIGTFGTTDPDAANTFTYSLVSGTGSTDNTSFTISGGQLLAAASFNYEDQNSYSIRIRSTDQGGLWFEKVFTIGVTDVSEMGTDTTLSPSSVAENQPIGTIVGTFSTDDPDVGDILTYALVSGIGGDDNGSFTIVGNTLQTAAVFSYATRSSYSIRVRTTDSDGLYFGRIFTITVTSAVPNQAPTDIALSNSSIPENQPSGTVVGTLGTTDPDAGNTFTYSLISGTGSSDNASFTISGSQLLTATSFNYEAKNSYSIRIRTTDQGGLYTEKVFTISVTDVNEMGTNTTLSPTSVAENQPIGTIIGTLSTDDPDAGDTFTYMLVDGIGGDDNAFFTISGNTLRTAAIFSYATRSSYSIRVRTTDSGGLYFGRIFTITVTDVDEIAPTVTAVYVRGSSWDSGYLSFLAANLAGASAAYGYAIPVGTGAAQLQTLPWRNLNRISIAFSEDVSIAQAQFAIAGSVGSYSVSGFSYSAADHVATWSLSAAIGPDKLYVALPGSGSTPVRDAAGNVLDGEWSNPSSYSDASSSDTFPSGNGTAGGNFAFRFDVLPGDSSGGSLGKVNVADVAQTKSRSSLPVSLSTYRSDFDGNNLVNVADVAYVKSKSSVYSLPVNPPVLPVFGPMSSQVSLLQKDRLLTLW